MENLRFVRTMSVEDFKKGMGVPEIEVKKNPHTGKCFFVYGNEVGAVSSRFERGGIDCSLCFTRGVREAVQHLQDFDLAPSYIGKSGCHQSGFSFIKNFKVTTCATN